MIQNLPRSSWSTRCLRRVAGAAVLLVLCALSCSRGQERAMRIAVLPVDDLSRSPDGTWVRTLLVEALVAQTAGAGGTLSFAAADANDAARRRASHLLRGYLTGGEGAWEFRGLLQEAGQETRARIAVHGASPVGLAAEAASQVASGLLPFTRNDGAAEAYARAVRQGDNPESAALLEKAAALDPDFGQPLLLLARRRAAGGDRTGSEAALRQILAPSRKVNPVVRVQAELLLASLTGDAAAHFAAAERLTALLPTDAEALAQFGGMVARKGDFKRAADFYRRALSAEPGVQGLWNEASYVQSFAGDLDGALASLAEYDRVSGKNPNAADSLGEIRFAHGRFAEARAAFLEAYDRSPAFLGAYPLRKAAVAALFGGDRAAAAKDFERYADAASKSPLLDLSKAQWAYLAASPAEALRSIRPLCADRRLALACAQQSVWETANGVSGQAAAAQAQALSRNPVEARWAALAAFVSQPDESAAVWAQRAGGDRAALAYALLVHKRFADAAPVIEQHIERMRAIESSEWRFLLGWAKLETGGKAEADALLRQWPFPQSSPDAQFEFLVFGRAGEIRKRAGY